MKFLNNMIAIIAVAISANISAADPGFDILNKSKAPIYITLTNGAKNFGEKTAIAIWEKGKEIPGSIFIDISKPTSLSIYKSQSDQKPIVHTFTPNKTIYLTYDGKLRPQTGTFMGWSGVTERGYPLSNNVKANDIIAPQETEIIEEAEEKAEGTLKDPAVEPKSKYTKQEWIEWYEAVGYTPEQYTPWLKGVKEATVPAQPTGALTGDASILNDILQKLDASSVQEAIDGIKEIEGGVEKLRANLSVKSVYESIANALNSETVKNELAKTKSFDAETMKRLNDVIVNAVFEGKLQLFEVLTVLKKYANPLIAKLIELQKAKVAGKSEQEILNLIPTTIQEPPTIAQMMQQQLADAVKAIKIEPPLANASAAAASTQSKSTTPVAPKDANLVPELLELLDAQNLAQALTNLNAAEKKVEQIKKNNEERLRTTIKSISNTLNSTIIAKQLDDLKVITPADTKKLTQLVFDAIYELKKQIVEAQLLLKKHANPLVTKLIAIEKAKIAGKDPKEIVNIIPTEIPQAPSIESMTKQQLLDAIKAIKLEPYRESKPREPLASTADI